MNPNLINKIIDMFKESPKIAILMSGKGTNAEAILRMRHRYKNLNFIMICTDQRKSNAEKLAYMFGLDFLCLEGKVKSKIQRNAYFDNLASHLRDLKIDALIYAGFMKIAPRFFINEFPGINLHPADLTKLKQNNKPKYTGKDAIQNQIAAGENFICSTAHVVDSDVDCGTPIMVSHPINIINEDKTDINAIQHRLKVFREHQMFPNVLELLSLGKLAIERLPIYGQANKSAHRRKDENLSFSNDFI